MQDDKQKIFEIMANLDKDFEEGNLSPERYKYFKAKYQEKLNDLDKYEATNRIRSMQGKRTPNINKRKRARKRKMDKKNKERNDLVQKYIVNPKKGDADLNKKQKSMDSSTFDLLVILILVIAFTIGITVGIFALDFDDMSVVNADALVEDTSFPDTSNVTLEPVKTNVTVSNYSSSYDSSYEDTYDSGSSSGGSYDGGGSHESGGGSSQGGGGSHESGGGSSQSGSESTYTT